MNEHTSIWSQTVEIPSRPSLEGDLQADVAVIGAGMAGILTAFRLKQRGCHVVVLEADRIGSGQTRNTTAKITSQHGLIYDALIQKFGRTKARQYAEANQQAIQEYAELIRALSIDCGFQRAPAYLYTRKSAEPLRREAEAAGRLGIDAHFTADTQLPFSITGAVRFEEQAMFHPMKFLKAVSEGLEIYENTPATSVREDEIRTPHGKVRAKYIVFASHYPFVNVPGWYFMRMHQERDYVLSLRDAWHPDGMYYGVDDDGLSFRPAEGMLLMGGGNHRTGENSKGGRYRTLSEQARELFPESRITACWSAQDCFTLDGVPYIGRFSASTPKWYVATGFAQWGMTTSMAAARLISGEIAGETPDWAEVFSPSRFSLSASAQNLAAETAQSVKGLTRGIFEPSRAILKQLPKGHGGIVEAEGEKCGVYKDEDGVCHVVQPRCPHLGCQLEWNPDEKSWDCPCHGSRFRYDGTLLDNPAQEGLKYESIVQ